MAMSVNPAIEGNQPLSSGHCDPAAMIGPRSTVPIRARGHVVPHQQAAHMTATGRLCTRVKKLLRAGGHPHMTVWPIWSNLLCCRDRLPAPLDAGVEPRRAGYGPWLRLSGRE